MMVMKLIVTIWQTDICKTKNGKHENDNKWPATGYYCETKKGLPERLLNNFINYNLALSFGSLYFWSWNFCTIGCFNKLYRLVSPQHVHEF